MQEEIVFIRSSKSKTYLVLALSSVDSILLAFAFSMMI